MINWDSKASREVVLKTIRSKLRTEIADYICQYNLGKKYAKKFKQACLDWFWEQERELVTELVF